MEPIQVSFTSKYIDGAQTVISPTPSDTHAGATIGDTTHHFTAAGEQINAIITSGQHFIDTAHTMATNVSLMNAIHAEATTIGSGKTKPSISRSRRQGSVADFEREHNLRALLGPQRGLPSHSFGAWSLLPEHVQKQFPQAEFNKAMSHARRELRAGTFVADSPVKHAIAEYFFRKEGWDV